MKKPVLVSLAVVGALGILAFAYYALSPLFVTLRMDEALPVAESSETVSAAASIVDTPAHPAQGQVRIVRTGLQTYVRYENLKTINGPDIFVYLAKDLDAKEFANLGRVKATEGNANYEVPAGINVADYRYVLIWCKAFGVLFNSADISGL